MSRDRTHRSFTAGALSVLLGLVTLTASSQPGGAHHTFVRKYDAKRIVKLSGAVSSVRWQNPHIFIDVDVKGSIWTVELEGIPKVQAKGLRREMLEEGAKVEISGWPDRSGTAELGLKTIKVKGKTISVRSTAR